MRTITTKKAGCLLGFSLLKKFGHCTKKHNFRAILTPLQQQCAVIQKPSFFKVHIMTKNAKPLSFEAAVALIKSHPACETPDILTVLNPTSASFYDEKTHEFALSLGLDVAVILTNKQKQVKRATQMLNCIRGGLVTDLDYTHTRILIAMRAAGSFNLNTDAIISLAANKITPGVETRGVTRGQVNHLFKMNHSIDTVKSKVSNSIGKNGYMNVLGIVERKGTKHAEIVFNPAHKFSQAFFKMIDSASDGQLQALAEKGEKTA